MGRLCTKQRPKTKDLRSKTPIVNMRTDVCRMRMCIKVDAIELRVVMSAVEVVDSILKGSGEYNIRDNIMSALAAFYDVWGGES